MFFAQDMTIYFLPKLLRQERLGTLLGKSLWEFMIKITTYPICELINFIASFGEFQYFLWEEQKTIRFKFNSQ